MNLERSQALWPLFAVELRFLLESLEFWGPPLKASLVFLSGEEDPRTGVCNPISDSSPPTGRLPVLATLSRSSAGALPLVGGDELPEMTGGWMSEMGWRTHFLLYLPLPEEVPLLLEPEALDPEEKDGNPEYEEEEPLPLFELPLPAPLLALRGLNPE